MDRYICDVLYDMREASKVKNFSYLDGLIEEAQSYANRMERGLSEKREVIEEIDKVFKGKKADKPGQIKRILDHYYSKKIHGR